MAENPQGDSIVPDLHCDEVLSPDDELRLDETFLGETGTGIYFKCTGPLKQIAIPRSTLVPVDEPQYCLVVPPVPHGDSEVGENYVGVDPELEKHLLVEDAQAVPSLSHEDITAIQQSSAAQTTTVNESTHLPTGTPVHDAAVNHCMTPCHPQTPTEAFTQGGPDSTLLTLLLKHQRSYLQMRGSVSNRSCNELDSSHWHSDLLFDDVCDCDAHLVLITRWDIEE